MAAHPCTALASAQKLRFWTGTSQYRWAAVLEIERNSEMIFIFIDSLQAIALPVAKLSNADEFYQYITKQHQAFKDAGQLNATIAH